MGEHPAGLVRRLFVLPWTLSVAVKKLVIASSTDTSGSNLLLVAVQFKVGSSVICFRDFEVSWRLLDGQVLWYSRGLESVLSTFHFARWDIRVGVVRPYFASIGEAMRVCGESELGFINT